MLKYIYQCVLAPPVIIGDFFDTQAAHTGEVVIWTVMVYSPSLFNITLYRSRMTAFSCNETVDVQFNYATIPTIVKLPVFGHELKANGFACTISLIVNTNDDFGYYVIDVSNFVGRTTKEMKIVTKGEVVSHFVLYYCVEQF